MLSNQEYSFFHSSHWAKVLCESYGYKPLYFVDILNSNLKRSAPSTSNYLDAPHAMLSAPGSLRAVSHKELLTCIPVMEVKSFLTGRRGVSLPFTDYCEPIIEKTISIQDIFSYLTEYGKQVGWKYIEIRGNGNSPHDLPVSSYYYGHILDLSQNEEQIFSGFRSSTRRNIKKAIKEGVKVNVSNSLKSIREFYRLNCITRKDHGQPPQPYYFFKKIYDHIISKNYGMVVSASYKGKIIAGAVYFHFGKKALFKYGASDKKYQHVRANNIVMWEAIKRYCKQGYSTFCFGRTEQENPGLRQFKSGWGAEEKIIKYYKYDLKKSAFLNGNSRMSELHNKVFNKMPIPLLKVVGSVLYKHIG